jgi:hypothetical protein
VGAETKKVPYRDRPSYAVTGNNTDVVCLPVLELDYNTYTHGKYDLEDCYLLMNKVATKDGVDDK